ncbi:MULTISPECIES: alpha/beta hydrolase [Sorangium]|uniref:Alpha/beta hydrolase n=1 Tax=Sorangium cellulosum TaxID=56 RepID=A0A4V0NFD6_SORCE|nr:MULTISPECIES: alpha/beta hydrolase [Sorangium]AUX29302.1 alpha/beta hydrolase [Sorangium cellulosum]WCQ88693.1 Monoacylglycerol lipase [Sorangium sp. Soce836]
MPADTFTFQADDGRELFVHRWLPDDGARGIFHIAHGMSEHAGRYARLAHALCAAGWAVYANDHRGHGRTARDRGELGFFASQGGFQRVVRDLAALIAREQEEHPGLPVVLFGHSMGSSLVQEYLIERGGSIQGAVLSGSSGKPSPLVDAGRLLARAERRRLGERGKSQLLQSMSFDSFNKQFAPARTPFDWLSRDRAEVDGYMADPHCGFPATVSLWIDLLDAMVEIARPERQARIPKDLPVYVFSGSRDPVGGPLRGVTQMIEAYRAAGLRRVTQRIYPGGRHEMLNEINREEVVRDLLAWLGAEVKTEAAPARPARPSAGAAAG